MGDFAGGGSVEAIPRSANYLRVSCWKVVDELLEDSLDFGACRLVLLVLLSDYRSIEEVAREELMQLDYSYRFFMKRNRCIERTKL